MTSRCRILQHQRGLVLCCHLLQLHITYVSVILVFGPLFNSIRNFSTCIEAVTLTMSFVCTLQFIQFPLHPLPERVMLVIELWVLILISASGHILKASSCEVVSGFCVSFCPLALCSFYWSESSRLQNSPNFMWNLCVFALIKGP